MKAIGLFLIAAVCLSSICPLAIGYSGGTGTPDDPYQIATPADLIGLGNTPADWDKAFVVTADIDLSGYIFDKAVIAPDTDNATGGFQGTQFTGVLDGNSLKISNLIITASTQNYVGLFGSVGSGGQIGNVGVENVNITGLYGVGGMVGENYGALTFCYATGSVGGTGSYVGGLVGFNYGSLTSCHTTGSVGGDYNVGGLMAYNEYGSLTFCYATGAVTGINQVGGLVGYDHFGMLTSCYATGSVTGSESVGGLMGYTYQGTATSCYATGLVTGNWYVGGLMGFTDQGTVAGCFWDTETSETSDGVGNVDPDPAGAMGKTTAEMMTLATFTDVGWDFSDTDGSPAVWKMTSEGFAYPTLAWQPDVNTYSGGTGTPNDPYQIATVGNLLHMSATPADWDKHFILTADIDLTGLTFTQAPIAPDTDNFNLEFQGTQFTGVFDGNDHTISNLTIAASTKDFVGLFGYVGYGGQIFNLGVGNVNMTGDEYVGGLVGRNEGSLTFCSATGSVTIEGSAVRYVGGLVGYNNSGTLTSCSASGSVSRVSDYSYAVGGLVGGNDGTLIACSATGSVTGGYYVGGLVGYNTSGTLTSCSATGSVSGDSMSVGGLVGEDYFGTLTSCYATGSVTAGGYYAGGLVGRNYLGTLTSCYATGAVIGYDYVGGLVGYNYGTLTSCYATGSVTCFFYVGGLVGYNDGGTINASFWDTQTSLQQYSDGGEGKTTAEMMTQSTFTDVGWDFSDTDGSPAVWMMTSEGFAYPTLARQPDVNTYSGGTGTPNDPYQIATVGNLLHMSATPADWDKAFILIANIDLTGYSFDRALIAPDTDESTEDFVGVFFTGVFNGNGHVIRNLTISTYAGSDFLGLFGYLDNAEIRDLRLEQASVYAYGDNSGNIGILAGYIYASTLVGCSSSGTVYNSVGSWANYSTGGLVGAARGEDHQFISLQDCSSSAEVAGLSRVGGLVGHQWNCGIVRGAASGTVTGYNYVGGLTGESAGNLDQCFISASVTGRPDCYYIGGLTGAYFGGEMTDSYSWASLFVCNGGSYIGGLVGGNWSNIHRCYSTGFIERCGITVSFVGGLAGADGGTILDSFWDIDRSGMSGSAGGAGLGTSEMMQLSTYTTAGWDFEPESVDGTPAVWAMPHPGTDYPTLVASRYGTGSGTPGNPFAIDTVEELLLLSESPEDWSNSFILTDDLDLSGYTFDKALIAPDNTPDNYGMFDGQPFTGTFDGNGHTISNLTILTEVGGDFLGLFGSARSATIKNLRMDNVSITAAGENSCLGAVAGWMYDCRISLCVVSGRISAGSISNDDFFWLVGGLAGIQNLGVIESCAARVNISSGVNSLYIGGMVGSLANGTIRHAFAAGAIDCGQHARHIGGLVGYSDNPTIENSCAHGSITVGPNYYYIGGLVGFMETGQVQNSYSVAAVSYSGAGNSIGGLVGYVGGSVTVTDSFWDIEATGMPWGDAGTGLTTSEMVQRSTYTTAGWDFNPASTDGDPADWRIRDGEDYPRLVWQPIIPGDIAGSPAVDMADLMAVAEDWMQACSGCPSDANNDGYVNLLDFVILGSNWMDQP